MLSVSPLEVRGFNARCFSAVNENFNAGGEAILSPFYLG